MHKQWRNYVDKFSKITAREQYLILFTGVIVFSMIIFNFFLEGNIVKLNEHKSKIKQGLSANASTARTIEMFQQALLQDPNIALQQQITQYEDKLALVDSDLLKLTSDLINPIQMRHALLELLKLQKGVKLISFEVMPVKALLSDVGETVPESVETSESPITLISNEQAEHLPLGLYQHTIKLKLQGRYFNLRDYLLQIEGLSWTFFWQKFQYNLLEYPQSELEIEIYSLSTTREFIGV